MHTSACNDRPDNGGLALERRGGEHLLAVRRDDRGAKIRNHGRLIRATSNGRASRVVRAGGAVGERRFGVVHVHVAVGGQRLSRLQMSIRVLYALTE